MPLLTSTSAFELQRRFWSSSQQYHLHCFRKVPTQPLNVCQFKWNLITSHHGRINSQTPHLHFRLCSSDTHGGEWYLASYPETFSCTITEGRKHVELANPRPPWKWPLNTDAIVSNGAATPQCAMLGMTYNNLKNVSKAGIQQYHNHESNQLRPNTLPHHLLKLTDKRSFSLLRKMTRYGCITSYL